MGAGCLYTLQEDRTVLAYWSEISSDDELAFEDELNYLHDIIQELPLSANYANDDGSIWYGELYKITFESTYYGDGIVIGLEYCQAPEGREGLQAYNYDRVYHRIIKHVNKRMALSAASSAWTSQEHPVNSIH